MLNKDITSKKILSDGVALRIILPNALMKFAINKEYGCGRRYQLGD